MHRRSFSIGDPPLAILTRCKSTFTTAPEENSPSEIDPTPRTACTPMVCPLPETKQTSGFRGVMSASDPYRTPAFAEGFELLRLCTISIIVADIKTVRLSKTVGLKLD
jgi:hypothetical protein